MSRLNIRYKLFLLCSAFLLPIGFLAYLFVAQTEKDVIFAAKELRGAFYLATVRDELHALVDLSLHAGGSDALSRAAAAVAPFDRKEAAAMDAAEAAGKAAEAVKAALSLPPDTGAEGYDAALAALSDHIARLEDGSNLTLDPDLDSYYAQDLATVKLPAAEISAARALDAARALLAAPAPSHELVVQFLSRKNDLAAAWSGIDGDITGAERGNPDGSVKIALESSRAALAAQMNAFSALLDAAQGTGAARPSPDRLVTAEKDLQSALRLLWNGAQGELEGLLQSRIAHLQRSLYLNLALTVLVFAAAVALAAYIAHSISAPLLGLQEAMMRLASGDSRSSVPHGDRKDEVGAMAHSVAVFRDGMIHEREMEAKAREEDERRRRRTELIEQAARDFDNFAGHAVDQVVATSSDMEHTAGSMSAAAEQTTRQSGLVSGAAEAASMNVQTVAAAAEELAASIDEISRQVAHSKDMASSAATEAFNAREVVAALSDSVGQIGDVVSLISDIASQTNLLALNATIEAARAGEAGKGFAVVASEVKTLADQTARATGDIGRQIAAVQDQTRRVVETIQAIIGVVGDIGGVSSGIAAAVEEQSAATREIARNIENAATGTDQVTGSVGEVRSAAEQTGRAAHDVLAASRQLSDQAAALRDRIGSFLKEIRSA